ncbi:MAG TPA: hypothetical protein VFA83_26125 [Acidimicrobiales bacterium]|nr:hypothetical protein [Acidimicrobiales bacterium]
MHLSTSKWRSGGGNHPPNASWTGGGTRSGGGGGGSYDTTWGRWKTTTHPAPGHDHDYERFAVQRGIRQITAGTGGRSLYFFRSQLDAGSEARSSTTFGVLQLTLHPTSYDWKFVPIAGETFTDSGTQNCT